MQKIWLIGSLLLLLFSSCGKIAEPEFRHIDHFKVRDIGLQGTTIAFDITFYNPNKFGVTVKEAACDIYIDSVYAGKFVQTQQVEVDKTSEFSLPLTGQIPLATALRFDVSKLVNRDILFKANGSVKVGKAGIYITKPFDYSGTHKISM